MRNFLQSYKIIATGQNVSALFRNFAKRKSSIRNIAKMQLIPLRTIRYSDSKSILTAFTRDNGRMTFLIPDGEGKGVARRRALFQPLFPIEGTVETKPGVEFSRIKEPHAIFPIYSLLSNPIKQSLAIFLAEILSSVVRHPEPDPLLFDFILDSVKRLETSSSSKTGNFHIVFLYKLAVILGISPDAGSYEPGDVFDMRDSIFRKTLPLHKDYILPETASLLPVLERLSFRTMHLLKLNRNQRNTLLDTMLHYYELHDFPIYPLRSLEIFRSIF